MRILFLSDAGSIHTYKWIRSLSELGHEIILFSLSGCRSQNYGKIENVKVYSCGYNIELISRGSDFLKFLSYYNVVKKLKKIINEFAPDILHAHYATSYGLLGTLSGFHPYILSVWGTDIFSFPGKSFLHTQLLKFNLKSSDFILSTSHSLKNETQKYTGKEIHVIPFGVDTCDFRPKPINKLFNSSALVIGITKNLEKIYGFEYLIKAFALLKSKYPKLSLELLIIGDGTQRKTLEKLCGTNNIINEVTFTGGIPHEKIPEYINMLDIVVFPSLEESFGVSILEASACGKPVIASNVGGIPEIIKNDCTGLLIQPKDVSVLVNALEFLIFNSEKRMKMGENGRIHVIANYEWSSSVQKLIDIYEKSRKINKLN